LNWLKIVPHLPKSSCFTLGSRIENMFLDLIEISYTTYFSKKKGKAKKVRKCIEIYDKLKFLISITWEAKLIGNRQYENIAIKLVEVGKQLGGWKRSLKNPKNINFAE